MELMHDVAGSAREVYGLFDALADAAPDDPRVDGAARALAAVLPDGIAVELPPAGAGGLADTFFADLAPAQSAAVRRAVELVAARRGEDGTGRGEADR